MKDRFQNNWQKENLIVKVLESEICYWPHNEIFSWWPIIKNTLILGKYIAKITKNKYGKIEKDCEMVYVIV